MINVEGSATDAELTSPDGRGTLAHTNHYACDRMRPYEGNPDYARKSAVRLSRALELLVDAEPGTIDAAWLRAALADHTTDPPICRHREGDPKVETAFWSVADVTAGEIRYGLGNPCDSEEQVYRFD